MRPPPPLQECDAEVFAAAYRPAGATMDGVSGQQSWSPRTSKRLVSATVVLGLGLGLVSLTPVSSGAPRGAMLGRPGLTITLASSSVYAVIVRLAPPRGAHRAVTYILVCSAVGWQGAPQRDARPMVLTTAGPHQVQPFPYQRPNGCRVTARSGAAQSPTVTADVPGQTSSSTTWLRALILIAVLLVGSTWIGRRRRRNRPDGTTSPPLVHPPKHVI